MEDSKNRECNRSLFARMVLPAFITAHIWNSDIRAVYSKFMERISTDSNPYTRAQNDERRKILENCLTLFTDVKLKKEIDVEREFLKREINAKENRSSDFERQPSTSELCKRIMSVFSEKLFGDQKRKYDMSSKYSDSIIATRQNPDGSIRKGVRVTPKPSTFTRGFSLQGDHGRTISLSLIGKLRYFNGFGQDGYLDQFHVTISRDDFDKDEYIVFTNIDLNKLGTDMRYTTLVIRELLSKNNIELSNSGGYIGEIKNTQYEEKKLAIGEESDHDGGFYRYQLSPEYALMYDPEHLSAVIDWGKQQQEKNLSTSQNNVDPR